MYFHCLVKFKGNSEIVFMGISNVMQIEKLRTMDNVDWVQGPVTDNGNVIDVTDRVGYGVTGKRVHPLNGIAHECPAPVPAYGDKLDSPSTYGALFIQAITRRQKIVAIKHFRNMTHCSLKEAKDFVDAICKQVYPPF